MGTTGPTADPTRDPTTDPTVDPTREPSIDPTVDPTRAPSVIPSTGPTTFQSAPPTNDVDDEFKVRIDVEYGVSALREADMERLTDSASRSDALSALTALFAQNYVDAGNGVALSDFALTIWAMNGEVIEELSEDDFADSLVTMSVEIECDDSIGELFITRSQTTGSDASFAVQVQSDLRAMFNNSAIVFEVLDADELTETNAYEEETEKEKETETDDANALYLIVTVVSLSPVVVICAGFVYFRKNKPTKNKLKIMPTKRWRMRRSSGYNANNMANE